MRLTALKTENWQPYRDANEVELGSGVYAVAARRHDDDTRSNWQGKSAFVETIRFLIFGTHHFDTDEEWITLGENAGGVSGTLSDGTEIERTKKRGSSTSLIVKSDGKTLRGKEAQARLNALVGMNEKSFLSSAYFEQKAISKLVRMSPGDRVKLVEEWFGLVPLTECEKEANSKSKEFKESVSQLHAKIQATEESILDDADEYDDARTLKIELSDFEEMRDGVQKELADLSDWREKSRQAAEYDAAKSEAKAVREELKKLKPLNELDESIEAVEKEETKFENEVTLKKAEVRRLKVVAQGDFDGKCPVAGRECPVSVEINEDRAGSRALLKDAQAAVQAASGELTPVVEVLEELRADRRRRIALEEELEELLSTGKECAKAKKYIVENGQPPGAIELDDRLTKANAKIADLRSDISKLDARVEANEKAKKRIGKWREELSLHEKAVKKWAKVALVFRRARKTLAERELKRIEQAANELVRNAGIDLSISLTWERRGKGLATHCHKCGAVHPTSQRVKECESCGAERGPKMVERLDVNLSDTSGAAEDIAGVALQLGVSKWIRSRRGSAWSTVVIDEPFGALDEANRGALSKHLATMLRSSFGFEQAFVISHDTQTSGAMPRRIQVVGLDDRSTFSVAC